MAEVTVSQSDGANFWFLVGFGACEKAPSRQSSVPYLQSVQIPQEQEHTPLDSESKAQKKPALSGLFMKWLPDLGSNQGPND